MLAGGGAGRGQGSRGGGGRPAGSDGALANLCRRRRLARSGNRRRAQDSPLQRPPQNQAPGTLPRSEGPAQRSPLAEKRAEEAAEKQKQTEAAYEWRDTIEKFVSHWDERLSEVAVTSEAAGQGQRTPTKRRRMPKRKKLRPRDKSKAGLTKAGKGADSASKKSRRSREEGCERVQDKGGPARADCRGPVSVRVAARRKNHEGIPSSLARRSAGQPDGRRQRTARHPLRPTGRVRRHQPHGHLL